MFGDGGGEEAAPDVVIGMDVGLPGLDALALRTGPVLGMEADLPGLDGAVGLAWDANVSRGGLRAELQACWQEARPLAVGLDAGWQLATPLRAATQVRWQPGQRMAGALAARWQETERLRAAVASVWQEGERLRGGVSTRWQETGRLRAAIASAWQEGAGLRGGLVSHWQEQRRLRAAVASAWQEGERLRAAALGRWRDGVRIRKPLRTHWQEARRPPSGVSLLPPVEPPREPCYDPATLGRLVFVEPWDGGGRLVFVCERGGSEPGATVVVPIRRVYMTTNLITLQRASDGAPIPAYSFGMSIDVDSWTWSWRATLHAAALPLIQPAPGGDGDPVGILATINGVTYHLAAEGYSRERQFGNTRVTVNGRGRAAVLDAPYAPVINHGNALARTAQQLMADVLTLNGVGIGWDVDWGLEDWLVPGGVWAHQGSYIAALQDIAQAAGGYLQPHATAATLRVLPRYPAAPWDWASLTPDYELPSAVVAVEGIEWQRHAVYDRVFVSGVGAGVLGQVTRAGTAGASVAPMVTHPLITHADAARQRGRAELSNTGMQAHISLRLPVLAETGVIQPGALVRYVDGGTTHLGLVRSTQLDWQRPTLRQVLAVETHPA